MIKSFLIFASLVATCFAQGISITAPTAGSTISSGQNITVEVDRPNSLTGSEEVAIVIAMTQCPHNDCNTPGFDVSQYLGQILYNGPYDPQYDNVTPPDHKQPHQNFTIQVPSFSSGDEVAMSVTHLTLVEAGPHILLEVKNISLTVE
ncbi:hypothetical protein AcV5_007390 [Taiwanofungus camphoratus]|nr:hypothetical protein AcV7_005860 [Antrodia cinnamomea]KAI0926661.1 hypothetical protein AcV5_007390 [Antrodia cinnamomea]